MKKISHRFIVSFFDQRWVLKVAIIVLSIMSVVPIVFFLAMVSFDYSYLGVRFYSKARQNIKLPAVQIRKKDVFTT